MTARRLLSLWCPTALAVLVVLAVAMPSHAQVKPGDLITADNATKVKDLLSPGTYYKVVHNMTMKIVPTKRIDWPPPYKEATEKYSGQVRLTPDHRSLIGYVAGQPFPLLDPNDPYIGSKVMWNTVFKPMWSDDYDLRFYDCDTTYQSRGAQNGQIEYFQIGHYAGYNLVGRTEVEPLPVDPDFRISNRYWVFSLYPVLAPTELKGGGFIRYRYADPKRGDDTWSYSATSRRVRRLNESILSSAAAGGTAAFSWDPDHYAGFDPKNEQYNYRLLGEKEMLGCVNAANSPEIRCAQDGGSSACPEAWEMRHLYILEATPRRERGGAMGAIDSKTIVYIDSELWFEPYIDTYDQRGQLFRAHIYYTTNRDRPVPDAKVAIYPFRRAFVVGAVSTDVQTGQATMCYLPGIETPERECWYINMGAIDKEFCTTQAMVKAGH